MKKTMTASKILGLKACRGLLHGTIARLTDIRAFISKDSKIAVTYKLQFVFQFCQVFFNVAVVYFIGQLLQTAHKPSLLKQYGGDYFAFALVGIAITSYSRAGLVSITEDLRQVMMQGTLEAMYATPLGHTWLLFCSALWQFLFETIRVLFHFILGLCLFGLTFPHANWLGTSAALLLTIPIFLMLGIISCSILIVVKRGDPINWIFFTLGGLLAGSMFPVAVLPPWLRTIAACLPLTHALEATRQCLLLGTCVRGVSGSFRALLLFNAILLPLTVVVNRYCMKKAKAVGAFSTY